MVYCNRNFGVEGCKSCLFYFGHFFGFSFKKLKLTLEIVLGQLAFGKLKLIMDFDLGFWGNLNLILNFN
jgi:hypothetical protein